jgi:hypothetical protein
MRIDDREVNPDQVGVLHPAAGREDQHLVALLEEPAGA